ncbi:hypothetical protein NEOLEDRAFT_1135036 [Neolentinus lepideus HHB14362 ss-1]|uniref:Uncharacterized protein n=1 Tax=Neolentinus lepideus HHB14362 ss-1 TaxID=1314782 RepID=A0A165S2U6_9AGAM|nr:hypothetical protein NEOLEDRAFT_1135036 [Neolentinus lepideus HHB14362 ss-1]
MNVESHVPACFPRELTKILLGVVLSTACDAHSAGTNTRDLSTLLVREMSSARTFSMAITTDTGRNLDQAAQRCS